MTFKHATGEKVEITVDGKSMEVLGGATILEAAKQSGIYIPTLCYLEKLNPIGSCRICSVEVEGVASPVMSCKTPVAKGMVITTKNERLKKYREDMIKMILVNHPLDCPVCERSGECLLQNRTFEFNITDHIWRTETRRKKPVVDWGLIQHDPNLCIMCERCVNICREIQGIAAYRIDGTGYDSRINTVSGQKLDCDFCGQCLSVCPVGALSNGMYFAGRSWEMKKIETICPHCSVGCSFHVNVKNEKIIRVTSDDNIGINSGNLCSRGRFGYQFVQSNDRLPVPLVHTSGGFKTSNWDEALSNLAEKLAEYKNRYGGKAFVGIGSEHGTNEDSYVLQKFFREVLGSGQLDNIANMTNPDVCSRMFEVFDDFPLTSSFDELLGGNIFVFFGSDGSNENPVVSNQIRRAIINHGAEVALVYSREASFLPAPRIQMVYDYRRLNEFLLLLLAETIKVADESGRFRYSVPIDEKWSAKLQEMAGAISRGIDGSMKSKIYDLIHLIKAQRRPFYLIGQEIQRHPQGTAVIQNIANLSKLTGGRVMLLREYCNSQGVNDMGVAPNRLPGYKEEKGERLKSGSSMIEIMENLSAKILIISEEDVLRRHPNAKRLTKAVRNMEYVVVIDQFFNETCHEADLILPSTASAENEGTFTNLEGRCQKVNRAVDKIGHAMPVWKILSDLAGKMGADFGYKNIEDVQAEIAEKVPLYKNIGKKNFLIDYRSLIKSRSALKRVEPPRKKKLKGDFVILQKRSLFGLGTYTDFCPSLRPLIGKSYADFELMGKPFVEMNPADAKRVGVSEEDIIVLNFEYGERKGAIRLNTKVRPGSIWVPDDIDNSPIESVKVNGREISCVNLSRMRG